MFPSLIGQFRIVQQQKNRVEVQGNNLHFPCFEKYKMLIIPLNLDSVLLLLHNSKLAYSTAAKTIRSVRFLVSFAAVFRLVMQRSSLVHCVTRLKTAATETLGFQESFEYRLRIKAAAWTLENKNGNARYQFEVEFSF